MYILLKIGRALSRRDDVKAFILFIVHCSFYILSKCERIANYTYWKPEAILYGMMQLQRKVKVEKFFGGVNHKEDNPNPLVISDIPKNFINEMKKTAGEVKDFVKKEINDTFK